LSITTTSPGRSVGASACSTQARKRAPLIAPSKTQGALGAVVAQRGQEGRGLPVTVRHGGDHPRAPLRPAVASRHGRGRPGLVDKDQLLRVQGRLPLAPGEARRGDVRAVLLGGVLSIFFRVSPAAARKRAMPERLAAIPSAASRVRRSAMVRSGAAATSLRTRSACAASRGRAPGEPYLDAHHALARRSTEYGRAIHSWPPHSSSQLESRQPKVVNSHSIPPNREPL
jgi:hypothetical protein